MHIITGIGRSGTSFIAEIFYNLGYEMGKYNPAIDAGFEHPKVTEINKHILGGESNWSSQVDAMKELSNKLYIAKDPRFIITLGIWASIGCKIESVFLCQRNYEEIIESTDKSHAGMMASFYGWSFGYRMRLIDIIENGFIDVCDNYDIPIHKILFPDSLYNLKAISCLNTIIVDKEKIYKAWKETIRIPKC